MTGDQKLGVIAAFVGLLTGRYSDHWALDLAFLAIVLFAFVRIGGDQPGE